MYDRRWVEANLALVWDPEHIPLKDFQPDVEMAQRQPTFVVSQAEPEGLARAEITRAWEEEHRLTIKERQALLLTIGMGFEQEEAGRILGVTQQAVSHRLYRGVGKLVEFLTGKPLLEDDDSTGTEQE